MGRVPSKRLSGGRLTSTMSEFSAFIYSCNLPLEGARFTWCIHDEVPISSGLIDFYSLLTGGSFSGGLSNCPSFDYVE